MDCFCRKIRSRVVIPVKPEPEPHDFDPKVRQKGKLFLRKHSAPLKANQFRNYWRDIIGDLHRLYNGICAYTCIYLMPPGSVDHFFPKSKYPHLAYEWSNYRLASAIINNRKGESENILDPFIIQPNWFTMDFPSCLIKTSSIIPSNYAKQATDTIDILKLNDDDDLVQERCDIIMMYVDGSITLQFLERRYPFIAIEIKRQQLAGKMGRMFKRRSIV